MQERTQFEYFAPNVTFGHKEGFAIAVGFIKFDYLDTLIEDPAVGEIKFYMK